MRMSRRRLLAGLAAAPALRALPSRAEEAGTYRGSGIAIHGDPKYKPGFAQFDYVDPAAPRGGSFWYAIGDATFDNLNPFILKGTAAGGIADLVFATLMRGADDEPFSNYAWVAKSIEVPKDRSWAAFEIDERARFHDGTPVTAEDVKFSFEILVSDKAHPTYAQYYKSVAKAELAGPGRVRFRFKEGANRELPLILGQLPVLSKAYWAKRQFDRPTLEPPLGSGTYKIAQAEPGRFVLFERIKNHWSDALPACRGYDNFDVIRYDYYRDETVTREAFKAGEYDWRAEEQALAWATQYDIAPVRDGRLIKRAIPNARPQGLQAVVFNRRRPIFADWRVRRALTLLFDFEWTNRNIFYGQYTRALSYFCNSELGSRGLPEGQELEVLRPFKGRVPDTVFTEPYTLPVYSGDGDIRDGLRRAFALLKEAGWEFRDGSMVEAKSGRPLRFEAIVATQGDERYLLPYFRNLARLGVKAGVRLTDPTQYQKRVEGFDYDVIMASWGQSESPGNEQRSMWSSAAADTTGSENYIGIKDKAIDELVDLVIAAPDYAALVARTRALDRVLLHHHFVVPCWYIDKDRLLWWDKFGLPPPHRRGTSYRIWWYDAAKAARLKGQIRSER
ncbi:MAG: ABC transporter substrate-binding protein [Rhodospirillaceae bacterium]|nr:ABC transporter substrate-binding protein [Rhodospirillaceae bacterium]